MQRNYFSILFFIRRTRLLKNGEAPIGLRITVNGQRAEMQIKRKSFIKESVFTKSLIKTTMNGNTTKYTKLNIR